MCATSGSGTAYPSRAADVTHVFWWGSYLSIFSFLCNVLLITFCISFSFHWPLYCLLLFDLHLPIDHPLWIFKLFLKKLNIKLCFYGIYFRKDFWSKNITQKAKDWEIWTPPKHVSDISSSGRVSSPWSTSGTHCAVLVTNPMITYEWGKNRIVNITKLWILSALNCKSMEWSTTSHQ
jgi:hypothetical protein